MVNSERTNKYCCEVMNIKKLSRTKYSRDDGWLTELISSTHDDVPFTNIHSYLVVIKPDSYRAMHYHKIKEEWLALTSGKIKLVLEDIQTKEKEFFILDENSKDYDLVYIPINTGHVVKNVGDKNASLVVFSKTAEIPGDTIRYDMEV
jgi:dTDP-4-dehydrorhamnose 3,5-epimerase-like enzyme